MRRIVPFATALALAAAVLAAPPPGSAAPGAAPDTVAAEKAKPKKPKKPKKKATPYAFRGHGYGTRILGGDLPAASGATALQSIGCTNRTGIHRRNAVADVQIPGLGTVSGVRTDVRTVKTGSETAIISEHQVARIVLMESSFGRLAVEGITSMAKASGTPSGYATETDTTLAKLVFTAPGGQRRELRLPTLNRPVVVPGLLRVSIGDHLERRTRTWARARANGLQITLIPTNTHVVVGRTVAYITKGIKSGRFAGSSNATSTSLLGGVAGTGHTQRLSMPCQGTEGKVKVNEALGVNLPGALEVGAVRSAQMGNQNKRRAWGYEESSVASINLGGGALVVNALKGRVNVSRVKGKKPRVNYRGSQVAGITVDGETYTLPELDGLEIPGLVKIQTLVKEPMKNGGQITALRLTLLDGTGAVVNLGQARLRVFASGR